VRWYYINTIDQFLQDDKDRIIGKLTVGSGSNVDQTQISAWEQQIIILKQELKNIKGSIFFEFSIPRMGKRVDVVLLLEKIVAVLEFKVGEKIFNSSAIDQVWDYALDLKNFHSTSHNTILIPVLIATEAQPQNIELKQSGHSDGVLKPILINCAQIQTVIDRAAMSAEFNQLVVSEWEGGKYLPTPTIVEAALALYSGHNVEEIVRRDADAKNLAETVTSLQALITQARTLKEKIICFVTGVPGAGKTLVGLDIATKNIDKHSDLYSVYLSGNGPLVKVLQEALAMDKASRKKPDGTKMKKGQARSEVKLFIQNVHHFRDDCLERTEDPPIEHVVIFDESQRAWNHAMTVDFMKRKKGIANFNQSEPEYLISCMDRHKDWAVIICLVGGGQEINRGEAGISEWISAVAKSFPKWALYCSTELVGDNYVSHQQYNKFKETVTIHEQEHLHLATSMRSFRATQLSDMVNWILIRDVEKAKQTYEQIKDNYPVYITRDVNKGRAWLRERARGNERYGMVVSSKAYRLRPHAIDVRIPADPVNWFLGDKNDVRSSYYMEDIATEFQIQGLELDWVCVTWDADLRYRPDAWSHHQFVGSKWNNIKAVENQRYLENAYRVLLTRARQGMVLVIPEGSEIDPTRQKNYYDPTYKYLKSIGLQELH
jgi:hypothetical protein